MMNGITVTVMYYNTVWYQISVTIPWEIPHQTESLSQATSFKGVVFILLFYLTNILKLFRCSFLSCVEKLLLGGCYESYILN